MAENAWSGARNMRVPLRSSLPEPPAPAPTPAPAPVPEGPGRSERPVFETYEEELAWAISKLEKCIRSRRAWEKFQATVNAAWARFLDPRAAAAGAEGTKWYTDAAMTIRSGLVQAYEVSEALDDCWHLIKAISGGAADDDAWVMPRDKYETMWRKLYLGIKVAEAEPAVHPSECNEMIEMDWEADATAVGGAGGVVGLSEASFRESWFEVGAPERAALSPQPTAMDQRPLTS